MIAISAGNSPAPPVSSASPTAVQPLTATSFQHPSRAVTFRPPLKGCRWAAKRRTLSRNKACSSESANSITHALLGALRGRDGSVLTDRAFASSPRSPHGRVWIEKLLGDDVALDLVGAGIDSGCA